MLAKIIELVFKFGYLHKLVGFLGKPYAFVVGHRTEAIVGLYVLLKVLESMGWLAPGTADKALPEMAGAAFVTSLDKVLRVWKLVADELAKKPT